MGGPVQIFNLVSFLRPPLRLLPLTARGSSVYDPPPPITFISGACCAPSVMTPLTHHQGYSYFWRQFHFKKATPFPPPLHATQIGARRRETISLDITSARSVGKILACLISAPSATTK